jgi:hypothetical protein
MPLPAEQKNCRGSDDTASQALLGRYTEAYQTARQAPLSGHRLAAYSIVVLVYELQRWPELEEAKIRGGRGEALMVIMAPIFDWDLVD